MGSTSLDSRVLSSAVLRVSGESMEKGVITADVATHELVLLRELERLPEVRRRRLVSR